MTENELRKKCRDFLKQFGYSELTWKGKEITLYHVSGGEPFGRGEFVSGTPAANALDELELLFVENGWVSYSVSK